MKHLKYLPVGDSYKLIMICAANFLKCCHLQVSDEEMIHDAEHLFALLKFNPLFEGLIKSEVQDSIKVTSVVSNAMDMLQSKSFLKECDQCVLLVLCLFVQWLVWYICKCLMQLMTPEALVLHRKLIPPALVHNYINYQEHFSLRNLLEMQLQRCM